MQAAVIEGTVVQASSLFKDPVDLSVTWDWEPLYLAIKLILVSVDQVTQYAEAVTLFDLKLIGIKSEIADKEDHHEY